MIKLILFFAIFFLSGKDILILKERLFYRLYWSFLPVAYAVLESYDLESNGVKKKFYSFQVESGPIVKLIYEVKTSISSITNTEVTKTEIYQKKQLERKKYKEEQIDFDWEEKQALFYEFDKLVKTIPLPEEGVIDPLTIIFFVRKYFKGESLSFKVNDGRKIISSQIKHSKIVPVHILNYKEAYLLQPVLDNLRGIFKKSPKASVDIWLSKDKKLLPLKIQSKVSIGSFKAILKKVDFF